MLFWFFSIVHFPHLLHPIFFFLSVHFPSVQYKGIITKIIIITNTTTAISSSLCVKKMRKMGRESKQKSIFFEGLHPHRNSLCPVLLLFFFLLRLRDSVCGSVSMCVWVCRCVQVCAHLWKEKKLKAIAGTISPPQTYRRLDPIVLWFLFFFWSSGPDGEEFEAPFLFFSSILPAEWKSSIIFPFSIVLFASVLLIMSHPDYLQLFPIATWLNFFYYNFFGGAFLSVLNILCRFTHLNGTVVFFCLFLYLFSIVGVYEGEGRSPEWHLFPGMDAESPRSQFIINQCPSWPVRVQISLCYLSPHTPYFRI